MKPYYSDELVTLYHGRCEDFIEDLSTSITITDPPYNVGKGYGEHDDSMAALDYQRWLRGIFALLPGDTLVYSPGLVNVLDARSALGDWEPRRLLGWHKREFAGDMWSGGPAMSWEPIIWATRGDAVYNRIFGHLGRDFLVVASTHGDPYKGPEAHPCPKPQPVLDWLVGLFGSPERPILDPFAGTGTTLVAARRAGVPSIGIEREERYCELAARRLAQGVLFGAAS